ncbi:hypothetical protein BDF22DRAFT_662473 [Syncephalis plumigaleata]|nr:hypothetical protein BDF22DRAFT_662473 [Syncephalis plumigaleata]
MEFEKSESICNTESGKHSIFILATQQTQYADTTTSRHYYGLELSAHSNLGQADDIVQNSSLSTSSNMIFLDSDNGELCYFIPGDQYIVTCHGAIDSNADLNITILSRQYGNVLNMFSIPRSQRLKAVEGNWILLEMRSVDVINGSKVFQTNSLMMFDIDNEVMCPGELNEVWHVVCFYKTTERAAIVYTARLVKEDTDRIEWALYRFSNNKSVKRLRSGWFQLPEIQTTTLILVYKSCDSQMIIELYSQFGHSSHVIHSVASGGQGSTPRNCIPIFDRYLPAPLLRAGFNYLMLGGLPVNVWTDADYNDDQILQIPGAMLGINVIGDLYLITAKESSVRSWYLVDINTKEVIRELDIPNPEMHIETYAMVGTISNLLENNKRIIQEYGAL